MSRNRWPSWPEFSTEEQAAVTAVLRSGRVNYWTGEECRHFEREFAEWCGVRHAVALTNGTVALELALRVMDIGPGDEVIVTSRSFVASANCIVTVGATPVFADVDPEHQNITPASITAVLTGRTKAIIAVHLAGWPCDMPGILALAATHGLKVIEDCAQAHGATIAGRAVGSFGDAAAWSFCQDKIMTTGGEGGMLTTNDASLWERAWSYKDHGKSFAKMHAPPSSAGFRWVHDTVGTNWRMLEIQAAIGRIQLQRMPEWHQRRTSNADIWRARLERWPALRVPTVPAGIRHAWYKFYVFVRPELLLPGWTRDRLLSAINGLSVPCFSGSCPEIYLEQAFADRQLHRLPVARTLGETSLMFLVHPTLDAEHIHAMADAVDRVMADANAA